MKVDDEQRKKTESVYGNRGKQIRGEYEKFEKRFREIQRKSFAGILMNLSADQQSEVKDAIRMPSSLLLSPSRMGDVVEDK